MMQDTWFDEFVNRTESVYAAVFPSTQSVSVNALPMPTVSLCKHDGRCAVLSRV
jgi:hypothetical protein